MNTMLTAEMMAKLDECVRYVAQHEYGSVRVVIERGRARRVRLEYDLSWEEIPQILQLNNGTAPK